MSEGSTPNVSTASGENDQDEKNKNDNDNDQPNTNSHKPRRMPWVTAISSAFMVTSNRPNEKNSKTSNKSSEKTKANSTLTRQDNENKIDTTTVSYPSTPLAENKNAAAKKEKPKHPIAAKGVDLMTDLVPQGILLRHAQRGAKEKSAEAAAAHNQQRYDLTGDPFDPVETNASSSPERTTPLLLTEDREPGSIESPAFAMACHLLAQVVDWHQWWSYVVFALLVFHPISTMVTGTYALCVATAGCAVYDLVWSIVQGQELSQLARKYFDLAMEQWVSFKTGHHRYFILVAIGIAMNPQSQQFAQQEVVRRAKRAREQVTQRGKKQT